MLRSEAMAILDLTFTESLDEAKIKQAWKQKIKHAHPDKNNHLGRPEETEESATNATQSLNEARDVLLEPFKDSYHEKKRREDEEERVLNEKQRAEAEAKRQAEDAEIEQKCEASHAKAKAIKRENYNRNRRKRLPTSRVHTKITDYQEGKALVEEMQAFFRDRFKEPEFSDDALLVSDILDLFIKSRDSTSILETNLFKRHAKRLFLAAWPNSSYSMCKNKRCFRNVCAK